MTRPCEIEFIFVILEVEPWQTRKLTSDLYIDNVMNE